MSLDSAALPSDYDYDGNYKDHRENLAEWVAILRASENNPTLKELVDQLRVLYHASKNVKHDIEWEWTEDAQT